MEHDCGDSSLKSESALVTPGVYYPRNKLLHRFRRKPLRKSYSRAVLKNGALNVEKPSPNHKFRFLSNWFVTMVEARWRWTFIHFFIAFVGDWLFFGFIYWIIALKHGDLDEEHLPPNQNVSDWTPCVRNIYGFTSTFLFSIEVHTTVAYGKRAITLECPQLISAMCLQCIVSSILQAFMVGILFSKLTRPKARTQTILFSKNAVICLRNEQLCLIFRVGDMRKSRILNTKASAYLIRLDIDGEHLDISDRIELNVSVDGCESTFFLWPVSVIHVIDRTSPLYKISAADLLCGKMEICIIFEGVLESTGQPIQARSSFIESELFWGHRFIPMVIYDYDKKLFNVDYSKLSDTEQVDTPLCSASEYDSVVSPLLSFNMNGSLVE